MQAAPETKRDRPHPAEREVPAEHATTFLLKPMVDGFVCRGGRPAILADRLATEPRPGHRHSSSEGGSSTSQDSSAAGPGWLVRCSARRSSAFRSRPVSGSPGCGAGFASSPGRDRSAHGAARESSPSRAASTSALTWDAIEPEHRAGSPDSWPWRCRYGSGGRASSERHVVVRDPLVEFVGRSGRSGSRRRLRPRHGTRRRYGTRLLVVLSRRPA